MSAPNPLFDAFDGMGAISYYIAQHCDSRAGGTEEVRETELRHLGTGAAHPKFSVRTRDREDSNLLGDVSATA